jgi:hypothetical protein
MTDGIERRDFMRNAGLIVGAAATATLIESPALAQTSSTPRLKPVTYEAKPLPFDPKDIKGISEKVLVSHYENNYVGAVKRLNAIGTQLAELDFAKAPVFMINGLKREELIATNSMILHEAYFQGLGGGGAPKGSLADAITKDFGSVDRWRTDFAAMGKAEGGGSGATSGWSTNGPPIIRRPWRGGGLCLSSTCTSTPIIWITAPRPPPMSTSTWKRSGGRMQRSSMRATVAKSDFQRGRETRKACHS